MQILGNSSTLFSVIVTTDRKISKDIEDLTLDLMDIYGTLNPKIHVLFNGTWNVHQMGHILGQWRLVQLSKINQCNPSYQQTK